MSAGGTKIRRRRGGSKRLPDVPGARAPYGRAIDPEGAGMETQTIERATTLPQERLYTSIAIAGFLRAASICCPNG